MLFYHIDSLFPVCPGVFIGGRPHTQSLEIAHSARLIIEHGLDDKTHAAVVQYDIKSYYDFLPVLRIAQWLLARGSNKAIVAAAIRHQLMTRLLLRLGGQMAEIKTDLMVGLLVLESQVFYSAFPWKRRCMAYSRNW